MKSSIRTVTFILLSITGSAMTSAMAHTSGGISIKDAWVREAPPNAPVLAAYLTIENHTAMKKVLTQATSSSFASVEFHRTEHHQDVARMIRQEEVIIPAEGKVEFTPGGLHLMLIKPGKSFKAGDNISLTFTFSDGSTSVISAKVKKASGGMDHSMHHDMKQDHHGAHDNSHDSSHDNMHNDSITPKHDNHHSH